MYHYPAIVYGYRCIDNGYRRVEENLEIIRK